jgi:hypothetical protein
MQHPAPPQSSPSLSGFAGLLAMLASPRPDAAADAPLGNSSDLGEDVATLSYERALRAHARYRPTNRDSDRVDGAPALSDDSGGDPRADASIEMDAAGAAVAADAAPKLQTGTAPDRDLRSASVTIRLSRAECARLHERAAEAGLTVSVYLRSCALEAETLRAEVKQALAELKAGNKGTKEPGNKKPGRQKFFGWIAWLIRRRR